MKSIMNKIMSNSRLKHTASLDESKIFKNKDVVLTDIPMLNVALSGDIDGGLEGGLTVIAGPSKHFKTSFALVLAAAYLNKHKDAILLFYDSEFSPDKYFDTYGIDKSRVVHQPIMNIEELKFDVVHQLDQLERKDKVIIMIDSIGNLASKKELDDALKESDKADMTRAKMLKGLFRMVTPYLAVNDIPMIAINHTYQCGTKEMTVQTPDGNISLANISVGDIVRTEVGFEKVSFTTKHEDALVTDIILENGETLSFTEGHRFKVDGKWKFLSELMVGDELDCFIKK